MMKLLFSALLACLPALAAPPSRAQQADEPSASRSEEAAEISAKLSRSLFFRGELADMMLEADVAGRYVDLAGVSTHAGARSLLLEWIKLNPDKAAEIYLDLKGTGGKVHTSLETRTAVWEFNPNLMEAIRRLNEAAGSSSVSKEAMETAARRIYVGKQWEEGAPVIAGPSGVRESAPALDYADFKLNKAGVDAEIKRGGAWLEAARPRAGGRAAAAYSAAFAAYRELIVAASDLKGREAVTRQESARLESLRAKLRSALAELVLLYRSEEMGYALATLGGCGQEPGCAEMQAALRGLKEELEARAVRIPAEDMAPLAKLLGAVEDKFAALYLGFTVYDGLLNLKKRGAMPAFSCFYDYIFYHYLAAYFPGSPYPRARAEIARTHALLDAALARAGAGDPAGALSGIDVHGIEAAVSSAASASSRNRATQFLTWGMFFRPVELAVSAAGGRLSFRPVFSMKLVMGYK